MLEVRYAVDLMEMGNETEREKEKKEKKEKRKKNKKECGQAR